MSENKKLSEKISEYEGGDYFITAGIWRPVAGFGDQYEIGIRQKVTGKFYLLQNSYFNFQSVQDVANAIAMLLSDKTQNYEPEWCIEWFGREP